MFHQRSLHAGSPPALPHDPAVRPDSPRTVTKRRGVGLRIATTLLAATAFASSSSAEYIVFNETSYTLTVDIELPLGGFFAYDLPPGENHIFIDLIFWPSGPADLIVESTAGSDLDFFVRHDDIEHGGFARIRQADYPWGSRLYVNDSTGQHSDPFVDVFPSDRRLFFLATADCQYDVGDNGSKTATSNAVHAKMFEIMDTFLPDQIYRGMIEAGDLTQNSQGGEFDTYRDSIAGRERYVYDGVGNHDLHYGADVNATQGAACFLGLDGCEDPSEIIDEISNRKHTTVKANKSNFGVTSYEDPTTAPLYSWDWDDVHFVQLGLLPGNGNSQGGFVDKPENGSKLMPTFDSLAFLEADLAAHVGDTGRPVVLVHHYHLDYTSFGLGAITHDERVDYWNAIEEYNVVAILTGHAHKAPGDTTPGCGWRTDWFDPNVWAGPQNLPCSGPEGLNFFPGSPPEPPPGTRSIPAFVVGGAVAGAFTVVEINESSQIRLSRRDQNGVEVDVEFADLGPMYVDLSVWPVHLKLGHEGFPFGSLNDALQKLGSKFADGIDLSTEILLAPGTYSAPGSITQAVSLDSTGGLVHIGM